MLVPPSSARLDGQGFNFYAVAYMPDVSSVIEREVRFLGFWLGLGFRVFLLWVQSSALLSQLVGKRHGDDT